MTTRKAQPIRTTLYAFILWGDRFDEEVAAIFATELRRIGICVKIVGLTGLQAAGIHGLVLTADWTLGQALPLANQAICVVVPCSASVLQRSEDDPRVQQFFREAMTNQAHFVISNSDTLEQTSLKLLSTPDTPFLMYKESYEIVELAHRTAVLLSTLVADPPASATSRFKAK